MIEWRQAQGLALSCKSSQRVADSRYFSIGSEKRFRLAHRRHPRVLDIVQCPQSGSHLDRGGDQARGRHERGALDPFFCLERWLGR